MPDPAHPRTLLRSIGAIAAGFFTIVLLSVGIDIILYMTHVYPPPDQPKPTSLWLLPTAYRLIYGILGCYVTARLAPASPMRHSLVLGVIGTLLGLVGVVICLVSGPQLGPLWYALAVAAMPIPCAYIAGTLAPRH